MHKLIFEYSMKLRTCIYIIVLLGVIESFCGEPLFAKRKKDKIEEAKPSAEELFVKNNFEEKRCAEWTKGRRFIYVSNDLSLLLKPEQDTVPIHVSFKNKIFTFEGMIEKSILGQAQYAVLIFDCEGIKYQYRTEKTIKEIKDSDYKPLLPDMVAEEDVLKARKMLIGKTLYIKTSIWYDENGVEIGGHKFVPVVIKDILPGDKVLPIKFVFEDNVGNTANVLGTLFPETLATQYTTFDRLFSFDNPRNLYKTISDVNWDLITKSKVMKGMTKDECRLSLCRPNDVRRIPTYGGLKEQWFYNTGSYLFFEDGILTDFRL